MALIRNIWFCFLNILGWIFSMSLVLYGATQILAEPFWGIVLISFGIACTPYTYFKFKKSNISARQMLGILTLVIFFAIIADSYVAGQQAQTVVLGQPKQPVSTEYIQTAHTQDENARAEPQHEELKQNNHQAETDLSTLSKTSLTKSIEPFFKSWAPISVMEKDGQIYVHLKQDKITNMIYSNFIGGGFCLGMMFHPELDLSDIKSVTILNTPRTEGWTFHGGAKECAIVNESKIGETSSVINEKKSFFKGQAKENVGNWHVEFKRSKVDDGTNVYLVLQANNSFINDFGKRIRPTLHIRCQENKTDVVVNWDTFLNLDEIRVLHRIGKEKAMTSEWNVASNHLAAFAPSPISFIRNLMKDDTLLIQTTPYGKNKITSEFFVDGLSSAVKPVQEVCGWK